MCISQNLFLFLIKPSLILNAGVGCFTSSHIPQGEQLSQGHEEGFQKLNLEQIPDEYLKFCVLLADGSFLSPNNFLRMGVFWYINHAKAPNLVFKKNKLYACRKIEVGEELTLYYSDLLTHPKNKLWVKDSDI